jgi:hypothetical protein
MSKFIGRKFNVGIGREATRGTAVAAGFWLPTTEITFDEKVDQVKDDGVIGVIENQSDAKVVKKYAEGSLSSIVNDDSFGLVLNATFGTCVTTGPTSSAYTHTFDVGQSAQHASLTLDIEEPNATTSASLRYPLLMVDSLDVEFEVGQFPTYSLGFMCNVGAVATNTPSYTAPDNFKPQDGVIRIADTYANIATGTSYAVRKASLSFGKNLEDDHNIGSVTVTDRLNKQFQVSGSFELVYNDREMITNFLLGDITRAFQIKFTNADKTLLGGAINPSITFKIAKAKFHEVAKNLGKDDIVTQTVSFEGYYSLSDSKMVQVVLVNDVSTYA